MPDISLTCRDCGASFAFTEGEQEFYSRKGFSNQPSRCPNCRQQRKTSREGGFGSGGDSGGGLSSSGSGYGGRRELYTAVCAGCGQEARVPFQPRMDKPVYCSDCFESRRGASSSPRSAERRW